MPEDVIHHFTDGVPSKRDGNILDRLQRFTFRKYQERGYRTKEQIRELESLGTTLDPRQVKFYRAIRPGTREEIDAVYPSELQDSRYNDLDFSRLYDDPKRDNITAALMSVAGQVIDKDGIHFKRLPWEIDDPLKRPHLDRSKMKFVWEWGRAAQDKPEEINPLSAASTAEIYRELMALGGRVEDAYVVMHSLEKANTRLYALDNPGSIYPADWKDQSDCLFVVPLARLLEKHAPSTFSGRAKQLIVASGKKLTESDALDFLMTLQQSRWKEMDLVGQLHQEEPVLIADWSKASILEIWIRAQALHPTDVELDAVMKVLTSISPRSKTVNLDQKYKNSVEVQLAAFRYAHHGAIEISNLDPLIAQRDPLFVMKAVHEVYMHTLGRLSKLIEIVHGVSSQQANVEALRLMIQYNVKFGVSTAAPNIQAQCDALAPTISESQRGVIGNPDASELLKNGHDYRDYKISIFSIEQIRSWVRAHMNELEHPGFELRSGYWQAQYDLSRVDIF